MAYATQMDVENAISSEILIQLTDDDESGAVDVNVIAQAISDAEARINSALASRYTVPIAVPIPDVIKYCTVWIAVCILGKRRGVLPEEYQKECDYWFNWLKEIDDGGKDVPGLTSASGYPRSTTETQQRLLVRDRLDVDGNSLNDDELPSTIDIW
jgi:phage gp36-like protein